MEKLNFRQWLEIAGTGKYSDLVPGWRGGPKGPYADPKRMPSDPMFWRNHDFQKQWAARELEDAKKRHELDPEDEGKRKGFAQATADALWSAMPVVPDSKPRGEYEGYTNWDTWAVALWANNERKHYEATRMKPAAFLKKYALRYKREIYRFYSDEEGDESRQVDFDMVNWDELAEDFSAE